MDYKLGLLALAGAGLAVVAVFFLYPPAGYGVVSVSVFDNQEEALASNVTWSAQLADGTEVGSGFSPSGRWEMPSSASPFVISVSSLDGRASEKVVSPSSRTVLVRLPAKNVGGAGPLSSASPVRFVIVSSSTRLKAAYGEEGAGKVLDSARVLAKAVEEKEGLKSAVVTLESEEFIQPYEDSEADFISAFQRLYARYSGADYVLLLGGADVVPFQKVVNPLQSADSDTLRFIGQEDSFVYSDQPYADARLVSCDDCRSPALGRMVSYDGGTAEDMVALLETATAAHYSQAPASRAFFIASGDSMDYTGKQVRQEYGDSAGSAPPLGVSKLFTDSPAVDSSLVSGPLSQSGILVLTLHGNNPGQAQSLVGRLNPLGDVLVFDLDSVENYDLAGKFLVADSCYSASPDRTFDQSLIAKFFQKGALGFVGPTTSALANRKIISVQNPGEVDFLRVGAANGLAYFTLAGLRQGSRIGDALKDAKKKLKEKALSKPTVAWFVDELTRNQFVLYGDPTLKLAD